jgi:hypothetical protein
MVCLSGEMTHQCFRWTCFLPAKPLQYRQHCLAGQARHAVQCLLDHPGHTCQRLGVRVVDAPSHHYGHSPVRLIQVLQPPPDARNPCVASPRTPLHVTQGHPPHSHSQTPYGHCHHAVNHLRALLYPAPQHCAALVAFHLNARQTPDAACSTTLNPPPPHHHHHRQQPFHGHASSDNAGHHPGHGPRRFPLRCQLSCQWQRPFWELEKRCQPPRQRPGDVPRCRLAAAESVPRRASKGQQTEGRQAAVQSRPSVA